MPTQAEQAITVITVTVAADDAEAVAALLQLFALDEAAEGVAIEQPGDPADLDPAALLPHAAVRLYIAAARDGAGLRGAIERTLAQSDLPLPDYARLEAADWATAWRVHYHPMRVGRHFVIQPSWEAAATIHPNDRVITLDPGMAFGTGTHPTTRLCLARLEDYVRAGDAVLDLGSGSGVLAIGAAMLGAAHVLAVDNDPLAVAASSANAAANGVADRIEVLEGSLAAVPRREWNVVVANILAPVLETLIVEEGLLTYITPGGVLILSGILTTQADDLLTTLARHAQPLVYVYREAEWVALVIRR